MTPTGPDHVEGKQAEGRARPGVHARARPAGPRRADQRTGSADAAGVPDDGLARPGPPVRRCSCRRTSWPRCSRPPAGSRSPAAGGSPPSSGSTRWAGGPSAPSRSTSTTPVTADEFAGLPGVSDVVVKGHGWGASRPGPEGPVEPEHREPGIAGEGLDPVRFLTRWLSCEVQAVGALVVRPLHLRPLPLTEDEIDNVVVGWERGAIGPVPWCGP